MTRRLFLFFLAVGWASALPVRADTTTANVTTAPPGVRRRHNLRSETTSVASTTALDAQVWRYLTPAQRDQWEQAEELISTGQADVNDGEINLDQAAAESRATNGVDKWYNTNEGQGVTSERPGLKATPIHFGIDSQSPAEARQEWQQEVAQGLAEIKQGQATLTALRIAARKVNLAATHIMPTAYTLDVPTQQWPDISANLGDDLMHTLQDQKYTRIYLGDVVAFQQSQYVPVPALADALRKNLLSFDGSHDSFVPTYDWSFKIARNTDNNLVIDFPQRIEVLHSGKAALVVAEVIPEPQGGYVFLSVRAVDLADWRIIYNRLYVLSIETSLGKLLGLAANQIASRHEIPFPATTMAAHAPAPAPNANATASAASNTGPPAAPAPGELALEVVDTSGFLASLKDAGGAYVFRTESAGSGNRPENRIAVLLLKSILQNQVPATLTDYDFLAQTLASDVTPDRAANPAGLNAAWSVANLDDENRRAIVLDLGAREISANGATKAAVNVGAFDIQRSFPPLTPPSAGELAAAGFEASSPDFRATSGPAIVATPPAGMPVPTGGGAAK